MNSKTDTCDQPAPNLSASYLDDRPIVIIKVSPFFKQIKDELAAKSLNFVKLTSVNPNVIASKFPLQTTRIRIPPDVHRCIFPDLPKRSATVHALLPSIGPLSHTGFRIQERWFSAA